MGRPVGSKNVSDIRSGNIIESSRRSVAAERTKDEAKSKKEANGKKTNARVRSEHGIVGKPIDFFLSPSSLRTK